MVTDIWLRGVKKFCQLILIHPHTAEMNDPERLAHWQTLFEEQLDKPKRGEKQYVKIQCYIAAQLLKKMKTQQ